MFSASGLSRYLISLELILGITCGLCVPKSGYSENFNLQSFSLRGRISSNDLLGADATESFTAYDLSSNFDMPWKSCSNSGLCKGTRLYAATGVMNGAGKNAVVISLTPVITIGSNYGRFIADGGAGIALLSRHRFGSQDFGGNMQFSLTAGLNVTFYEKLGIGYRYQHYSDAGMYGPGNVGVDMHMVELIYGL